jgi:MscS family membrane protein
MQSILRPCRLAAAWAIRRFLVVVGALHLVAATTPAAAQPDPATGDEAQVAADSPRMAVMEFLDLCREGDYQAAARYLALQPAQRERGAELARRLKAVLDRHLWLDLEALSPASTGEESDGLPGGVEEIGTVRWARGEAPVRLIRASGEESPGWAFSPDTVSRIDRWYGALGDRWLRERLPEPLLRPGPFDLAWWQWAALPILLLVAWGLGRLLAWVLLRLLAHGVARTRVRWDDALIDSVAGPVVLACSVAAAHPLTRSLALYAPAEAFVGKALGTLGLATLFWAMWRGVGVLGEALRFSHWATGNTSAQSALSIGIRLARVAVIAVGVIAVLSQLGYPVAGLVAGLGLGGLAFALAAQKTVENLFGSVSLAIDAPFRVGDFVKVEDFVGTVEAIGLRSTRIRTLDRTLVTVPNGRLADMRLESYSARDRMRLACTIGLVYGTSAAQMRQVLEGLEAVLREHPLIWPDAVVVRFKQFGSSSLDIEVMAWFRTSSWTEFQLIRQEVLLRFMEVVEEAGTGFAFPTRTVHVVSETSELRASALQ